MRFLSTTIWRHLDQTQPKKYKISYFLKITLVIPGIYCFCLASWETRAEIKCCQATVCCQMIWQTDSHFTIMAIWLKKRNIWKKFYVYNNLSITRHWVVGEWLCFTFSSWIHSAHFRLDTKVNPIMPMIPKRKT